MCSKLESAVIRDSSLVTPKYGGGGGGKVIKKFVLVNVPLLTQLWVKLVLNRAKDVGMFSSVLPQLEMLKIYSTYTLSWKDSREFTSTIEMFNLKELVRFVVEAATHEYSKCSDTDESDEDEGTYGYDGPKEIPRENLRAYFILKEVEFVGYGGKVEQLELIRHFVEKNPALTKITIDPRCFKLIGSHPPWDRIFLHKAEDEIYARAIAKKQLKKHVPSTINVQIL